MADPTPQAITHGLATAIGGLLQGQLLAVEVEHQRRLDVAVSAARAAAWDEGAREVWAALAIHAWSLEFYLDDNPYRRALAQPADTEGA